jgi:hypothetical protein
MTPRIWVNEIVFNDGTALHFGSDDLVLVVGANNSGKSAALRGIHGRINGPFVGPVIARVKITRVGTSQDVIEWLESFAHKNTNDPNNPSFQAFGQGVNAISLNAHWQVTSQGLQGLTRFFCNLLSADQRLALSNPAQNIAYITDAPSAPQHYLYRDEGLERRLSSQFRAAFGVDLIVNRVGGNQVPLHVGNRPDPKQGQDRLSLEYLEQIVKLPLLHVQGDGMRSFAGVLLYTAVGRESVLLIDEPEAFLHPPQARELGRMLAVDRQRDRQMFVATHSGDVLRGVLDGARTNVRVIRLRRDGSVNRVSQLENAKLAELWSDPLLRYSNILDGLFHERVIVCEGDADARFYSAIMDALVDSAGEGTRRPDIMFVQCGGKDRIPMVMRALREVSVPVAAVVDFDVLRSEQPLRDIVEAAAGSWNAIEDDWKLVKASIESKKPELPTKEVGEEIGKVLNSVATPAFPDTASETIRRILRRSSPWAIAKNSGKTYIPSGDPTRAFDRLYKALNGYGVFIVDVGEVEMFVRSVGNHGPKWVNEVLKKNLISDPELAAARQFVAKLMEL